MKQQQGFTLVELVIVIVVLGILAAVAVPKFVDLSKDADEAAIKAVAASLTSASAMNYGGCSIKGQTVTAGKCVKIAKCSDAGTLLNPTLTLTATASTTAYHLDADTTATTNGTSVECTIKKATYAAKYTAIGAANQ